MPEIKLVKAIGTGIRGRCRLAQGFFTQNRLQALNERISYGVRASLIP